MCPACGSSDFTQDKTTRELDPTGCGIQFALLPLALLMIFLWLFRGWPWWSVPVVVAVAGGALEYGGNSLFGRRKCNRCGHVW